jgi:hypothetical protein
MRLDMAFLRELYDRLCSLALLGEGAAESTSDEELDIEKEVEMRVSLGCKADRMVDELVMIGRKKGFILYSSTCGYGRDGACIRAQEIGRRLNDIGGLRLMKQAWWRVRFELSPGSAGRDLDIIWDRIGEWRG